MDRRLTSEDLEWLKLMRSLDEKPASTAPPATVGQKLTVLGFAAHMADGAFRITYKGRDELIDRERADMRWQ